MAIDLPHKLKEARESLGLSIVEAAQNLGFQSYQTLSKIESGERQVKASELPIFAKIYCCSVSVLLGEKEVREQPSLLWRKSPPENEKKYIEAQILHFCEQYHLLEKLLHMEDEKEFRCMEVTVENLRTSRDIDILAEDTRNTWGLGSRPAFSLSNILEQKYGVKIVYRPLGDIGSGASMVHPEYGPVAVVNSEEAPWRRNYDMAHELFHLVTWNAFPREDLEEDPDFFDVVEKKAERFASTLLLPESEVKRAINARLKRGTLNYSDLVDIAREFGVSTIALIYRLSNLRLLKREQARQLAEDEELKSLDKKARRGEWGHEPVTERFYFLAAKCLRKGLLSRGRFAEMVNKDRIDIDEFLEDLGLMETEGVAVEIMDS